MTFLTGKSLALYLASFLTRKIPVGMVGIQQSSPLEHGMGNLLKYLAMVMLAIAASPHRQAFPLTESTISVHGLQGEQLLVTAASTTQVSMDMRHKRASYLLCTYSRLQQLLALHIKFLSSLLAVHFYFTSILLQVPLHSARSPCPR